MSDEVQRFVRYKGASDDQVNWGSNDDPRSVLTIGRAYRLKEEEVHDWHTKYSLVGVEGRFNSVHFEDVDLLDAYDALLREVEALKVQLMTDATQGQQLDDAMTAVRILRRQLDTAIINARNRASDCGEHMQDLTRSQIKVRELERQLAEAQQRIAALIQRLEKYEPI